MVYPRERKRTGGLRSRAWWVLRKNKQMSLSEMMNSICTGVEKNAQTNLRTWLNRLVTVGILEREKAPDGILTSNGSYIYSLKKDLGSLCPVVQIQLNRVYDPNQRESYPLNPDKAVGND